MPGSPPSEPTGPAVDVDLVAIGAELLRIRRELGISQAKMATELNLQRYSPGGRDVSTPRATISAFEHGRRPAPAAVLAEYERLSTQPERLRVLLAPPPPASPADADSAPTAEPATEGLDAACEPQTPGPVAGPSDDLSDGPGEVSVGDGGAAARVTDPEPSDWWRRRALVGAVVAVVLVAAGIAVGVVVGGQNERPRATAPSTTWTETTGGPSHTWSDPAQAAGRAGPPLGPRQSVQVSCRVRGFVVPDGDPWWYRIESAPWSGDFYATSDAFYNNGDVDGPFINGVVVDEQVPLC